MEAFAVSIAGQHALDQDPAYRTARDDVARLRRHLQMEADRAEDRRRELATLRAELTTKTAVIAGLRAELNRTTIPVLETVDGDPHDPPWGGDPGVRMSRQQRRAAARAAHKNE
jgi:hypothetical protein